MKLLGDKLKTARILAGFSLTELADRLKITKQSLSQYENGTEPKLEVYLKIMDALGCKNEFLTTPFSQKTEIKNTFFRASAAADVIERKNQEIKTDLVVKLYKFLTDYLELPKLNIPEFDGGKNIEDTANSLREYWGLSNKPIKNMINCLESNGIIVSSFNSSEGKLSYKIDGYTQQVKGLNSEDKYDFCVIVENNKESWVRKNFSLAHELGHIILHSCENYMELSRNEQNQIENQANLFASAFLLPKEEFSKDMREVHTLKDYVWLKEKWYVSIGAMMIRAKQLNLISDEEYIRLIKNYSYHQYKKGEPLDDKIKAFHPVLFKKSFEVLFDNGFTVEQLDEELEKEGLSLPYNQIEELLCLGTGFFDCYKKNNEGIVINFRNS